MLIVLHGGANNVTDNNGAPDANDSFCDNSNCKVTFVNSIKWTGKTLEDQKFRFSATIDLPKVDGL